MADTITENKTTHVDFPTFEEVGTIDVDAGLIMIGDPCYTFDKKPKSFGDGTWGGFSDETFERSGYYKQQDRWNNWRCSIENKVRADPSWLDSVLNPSSEVNSGDYFNELLEKYAEEEPFDRSYSLDTGVANFEHDLGHGGAAMTVQTFYGDGSWPVYVEYKNGRPRRVLIDFDPEYSDE